MYSVMNFDRCLYLWNYHNQDTEHFHQPWNFSQTTIDLLCHYRFVVIFLSFMNGIISYIPLYAFLIGFLYLVQWFGLGIHLLLYVSVVCCFLLMSCVPLCEYSTAMKILYLLGLLQFGLLCMKPILQMCFSC